MTALIPVLMPVWAQMLQAPGGGQPEGPPPLPFPEIAAPPVVEATLPLHWLVLGVLLLLAAVWFLLKPLFGRVAQAVVPARRPLQAALRALRELKSKSGTLTPAEIGHGVSETLRTYYLHRYGVPAPYRTTEELFPSLRDADETSRRKQWRDKFEPLAAYYDVLAYAPESVTRITGMELIDQAIAKLEDEVGSMEPESIRELQPGRMLK